jgi:hypothetical protein
MRFISALSRLPRRKSTKPQFSLSINGRAAKRLYSLCIGLPYDKYLCLKTVLGSPRCTSRATYIANETRGVPQQPSAVTTINGEEVVKYSTRFAARISVKRREPYADGNMLARSGASDGQGYLQVFGGDVSFYPTDIIAVAYENGTVRLSNQRALPPAPTDEVGMARV